MMKVVEIFKSIDGEGKRAGLPTTFIRLYGCNLRCSYCDSQYAWSGNNYEEMSVDEILTAVKELGITSITLTGGEPLFHKDVKELLSKLVECKFDVNVETNGTQDIDIYRSISDDIWFTVDYKCNSSLVSDKMNEDIFKHQLKDKDVLKFVVGSDEDLKQALDVIKAYKPNAQIYFSPVFGFDASKIVAFLLAEKLYNCKVQLQLHKYIWDEDKRGV